MNSFLSLLLCVTVFYACEAKIGSHHHLLVKSLHERQNGICKSCTPSLLDAVPNLQIEGVSAKLPHLAPFLTKLQALLSEVTANFNTGDLLNKLKDIIPKALDTIYTELGPVIADVIAAFQPIIPCDTFLQFVTNLKVDILAVVSDIKNTSAFGSQESLGAIIINLGNSIDKSTANIQKLVLNAIRGGLGLINKCQHWILAAVVVNMGFPTIVKMVTNWLIATGKKVGSGGVAEIIKSIGGPALTTNAIKSLVTDVLNMATGIKDILDGKDVGQLGTIIDKLFAAIPGQNGVIGDGSQFLNRIIAEINQDPQIAESLKALLAEVIKFLNTLLGTI